MPPTQLKVDEKSTDVPDNHPSFTQHVFHSRRSTYLRTSNCTLPFSFLSFPTTGNAVRCYACTVKVPRDRKHSSQENGTDAWEEARPRLCSQFDGGRRFEVDCPLSTLCQSRTFWLHTQTGRSHLCVKTCIRVTNWENINCSFPLHLLLLLKQGPYP